MLNRFRSKSLGCQSRTFGRQLLRGVNKTWAHSTFLESSRRNIATVAYPPASTTCGMLPRGQSVFHPLEFLPLDIARKKQCGDGRNFFFRFLFFLYRCIRQIRLDTEQEHTQEDAIARYLAMRTHRRADLRSARVISA